MNRSEPDPRPVFLTGLDRTGKTPFRRALLSHSSVWLSRRTALWSFHHGRYGDLAHGASLDRCLRALLASPAVAQLVPDPAELVNALRSGVPTYGRLFGLILGWHAASLGKPRWGEQDAELELAPARVFADYPDATVIHFIRDPRFRLAGVVRDSGRRPGDTRVASGGWARSVRRAEAWQARFPGRYLMVRAEDFGDPPADSLAHLAERLSDGRPLRSRLVEPTAEGLPSLPQTDVAFIEEHVGDLMERHGYRRMAPRLSAPARLRYRLVELPAGELRLAVRRARARTSSGAGR
ncbi:MAG TPA: sulfotransferase [Candidatus Limnocylindria bacterium]|nr:sulfotransferase [Candidatus Limnocylindria bacterium]